MDALRVGAMVHRNIEFMDAVGQPGVPPRHLLDHAEGEPLFLVLQRRRAAGRQHSHEGGSDGAAVWQADGVQRKMRKT